MVLVVNRSLAVSLINYMGVDNIVEIPHEIGLIFEVIKSELLIYIVEAYLVEFGLCVSCRGVTIRTLICEFSEYRQSLG